MKKRLSFESSYQALQLLGKNDEYLRLLQKTLPVKIRAKGHEIFVEGEKEDVEKVLSLFKNLEELQKKGWHLEEEEIKNMLKKLKKGKNLMPEAIFISERGKVVAPRTEGQRKYVEAIKKYDIVVGIGPAGTGKTYLAVAMAICALKNKEFSRIILARPAVEAGEKLGYLPGNMQEKVDPYLRPLYDALYEMITPKSFQQYLSDGIIEIAPLAYMRGRTLNDSFVILDEAQNTTVEQMKMCLTRLGFDSKLVITGDITQIDLPPKVPSGLVEIQHILAHIKQIKFIYFTQKDIVRHPLVQEIVKAYQDYEASRKSKD